MFIFTAKIRRKQLLLLAAAVAVLAAVLVFAAGLFTGKPAWAGLGGDSTRGKSNEDRIAYLESYGWVVRPEPIHSEELLIPEEFDDTYRNYLELQTGQGFDLSKYRGKTVVRYSYQILNYPTGEEDAQAGLLVYKNRIIGGEVLSPRLDGFLHGLEMPETEPLNT